MNGILVRAACAATLLGCGLLATPAAAATCSSAARDAGWSAPVVRTAADEALDLDAFVASLADTRAVFLGEHHDRLEHHLNQVEVICRLRAQGKAVAVGMEAFQQPFQSVLDAFVAGDIDETAMLRDSEYFSRWRFDYRLYAPILRYARQHQIPVVALNIPREVTSKVSSSGIESLTDEQRGYVPDTIDRDNARYRKRLRKAYAMHPPSAQSSFERFLDAQLLWDEGMAARAARWLDANPQSTLVVIAGEGHITYGDGIPGRLARRLPASQVTVLQSVAQLPEAGAADYAFDTPALTLPPAGRLGVVVEESDGGVRVREFADKSAAKDAGVQARDRIVSIDGLAVRALSDVRIALFDKAPGAPVDVELARASAGEAPLALRFKLR